MRLINGLFAGLLLMMAAVVDARDPTQPPGTRLTQQRVVEKSLRLSGIFLGKRPHAIINGYAMAVGERYRGIELIKIEPERVLVQWKGAKRWLTLVPTTVKQRVRK